MHGKSLLLELLNERASWNLPPYRAPAMDGHYVKHVSEAAHFYAKANDSDPFSAARIRLYMIAGFTLPSDVIRDSKSLLDRRANEEREKDARLQAMHKRMQSDMAWNQHKASQWQDAKRKGSSRFR